MNISGQVTQLLAKVEENEKFEFIFRNTSEAVFILDLEIQEAEVRVPIIRDANQAALNLFQPEGRDLKILSSAGFTI